MSTALKVVAPLPPEVTALTKTCEDLAKTDALERFEIAVANRLSIGIANDNDLRLTDELLHSVVLGADAVEAATKPMTSAAYALHKALVAEANKWKARWTTMADGLKGAILKYKRAQEELARRQQAELDRAAAEERQRKEAEAKAALRNGDVAAAQTIMQEAQAIVTPIIADATPMLDNSSTRKPWQVEITDPEAVVKAIAAGTIPLCAIKEFDLGFLKKEATKRGGLPANWVGIRVWQEEKLSVRR